ncbi:tetratricopeptide repeat protein [Thiohalobacter sp. IOR34]|uniref:tetratricopeptide repeat protein n=1 Tax=Thiohalobacter sp. IOR34 TaxID=3057176 RepID=UPI0025B27350|nr:tetratricopeptide repeat protein [Thiohalobacter sp. IOR34]WJW76537.1 tetratricopeptide repeat protein [Thiohalobacter sp. IOR34]
MTTRTTFRWLPLAMLLLGGCASVPPGGAPPVEERGDAATRSVPAPGPTPGVERRPYRAEPPAAQRSAVETLVARADRAVQGGQWAEAGAALERALRIAPGDARLWYQLAEVRLAQGRYAQAVQLARKSNGYASGEPRLLQANWRLIAEALEALGDGRGAAEARRRAARYP